MEPVSLTALVSQLGIGGAGVVLMLWAWSELRKCYEARIVDLKENQARQMRLLQKALKIELEEQ